MNKAGVTRSRLQSYFEKDSGRSFGVVALYQHFSDVKVANLNYHLKNLTEEGFLIKPKRGLYQKNPAYKSPEEKRRAVEEHLQTNGSRVQSGTPWKPGDEPLKEVINPVMFAYLGRSFGNSIVERMKVTGFSPTDLKFIETLLQRAYPLSEQQRYQCERVYAGMPTVPSSVSSNGRSGSGSS